VLQTLNVLSLHNVNGTEKQHKYLRLADKHTEIWKGDFWNKSDTLLLCLPAVIEQGLVCVIRQIGVTTDDLSTCTAVLTRHLQVQLHVYLVDDAR